MEKKTIRKTFRVSRSLHDRCQRAGIRISYVCRSALLSELSRLENPEKSPDTGTKLVSIQESARIYNNALCNFVQTLSSQNAEKIARAPVKLPVFGHVMRQIVPDHALPALGDFLQAGECSEELLSQIFIDEGKHE